MNGWIARVRRLTLEEAVALLPYTSALAGSVSVALVLMKRWRQPQFPHVGIVVELAVVTWAIALVLAVVARRCGIRLPASANPRGAASWVMALHAGLLLLPIAVLALVKNVGADDIHGWIYPFINKRWLVALYGVALATFLIFPVAIEWWRASGTTRSASDVGRGFLDPPRAGSERTRPTLIGALGLLAIVALAWYFAGPPWHIDRLHRDIEAHEQAHLGGLQAIDRGYVPYLGPASTQYGPGSQVLIYTVMKRSGPFDIVSFRRGWAVIHFAAMLIVSIAAYCWLGLLPAIAVVVMAVIYSPLALFATAPDGTLTGFFGWGNAFRYIAPLLVVPALVSAAIGERERPPSNAGWVVLLGIVWGAASWMSQENLSSTAMAGGLLLLLLCLTRTTDVSRALRIGACLMLGFACAAAPVLLYYATHVGRGLSDPPLATFLHNYFAVPQAVAAGYSNQWWLTSVFSGRGFYLTPAFLIGLAVVTLWRVPALELVAPLDRERARFLAFLCVQLVCYQVALLRSDSAHLQNTMLALPFILVLGVRDLPRWLAARGASPAAFERRCIPSGGVAPPSNIPDILSRRALPAGVPSAAAALGWSTGRLAALGATLDLHHGRLPRRIVVRATFILLALAIYPSGRLRLLDEILARPSARFMIARPAIQPAAADTRVAYQRATHLVADGPEIARGSGMATRAFLDFATDVHAIAGGRKTYVADAGGLWSGLLYFLADLTPAPYPLDRETMMINDTLRAQVVDHIRTHPADYECYIGSSLDEPEARAFLDVHPGAVRLERTLGPRRVHIALSK